MHPKVGMSVGKQIVLSDLYVVALYDSKTGEIVHAHNVRIFQGGRPVSEDEAIAGAKAHALRAGHKIDHLIVKISKNADHGRRPHKIDLETGQFVPLNRNAGVSK